MKNCIAGDVPPGEGVECWRGLQSPQRHSVASSTQGSGSESEAGMECRQVDGADGASTFQAARPCPPWESWPALVRLIGCVAGGVLQP